MEYCYGINSDRFINSVDFIFHRFDTNPATHNLFIGHPYNIFIVYLGEEYKELSPSLNFKYLFVFAFMLYQRNFAGKSYVYTNHQTQCQTSSNDRIDFIAFKFIIHFGHFGCAHKSRVCRKLDNCNEYSFAFDTETTKTAKPLYACFILFLWCSMEKRSWIWYCGIVVLFTRNSKTSKISIRFKFHRILLDFDISTKKTSHPICIVYTPSK